MQVIIENGQTRFIPSSLDNIDKNQISQNLLSRFTQENNPHSKNIMQKVEKPVFCFSCKQAVVECKDQACPSCVQKIRNNESIAIRPSWIIIFLIGVFSFAYLFFNWFFQSGK